MSSSKKKSKVKNSPLSSPPPSTSKEPKSNDGPYFACPFCTHDSAAINKNPRSTEEEILEHIKSAHQIDPWTQLTSTCCMLCCTDSAEAATSSTTDGALRMANHISADHGVHTSKRACQLCGVCFTPFDKLVAHKVVIRKKMRTLVVMDLREMYAHMADHARAIFVINDEYAPPPNTSFTCTQCARNTHFCDYAVYTSHMASEHATTDEDRANHLPLFVVDAECMAEQLRRTNEDHNQREATANRAIQARLDSYNPPFLVQRQHRQQTVLSTLSGPMPTATQFECGECGAQFPNDARRITHIERTHKALTFEYPV